MSGHLIGCVKHVDDVGTSHKLALLAFADSADDRTHIAFPGYEGVQTWAGVSRSRAAELIADLVDAGHLAQHRKAHRGRRAEYVVFPGGCCALHRTPAEEPAVDVEALAAASGISIDQARTMLDFLRNGSDTPDPLTVSDAPDPLSGNVSDTSDPLIRNGSDTPDPLTDETTETTRKGPTRRTRTGERVQKGSDTPDPFITSSTTPQPPAAAGGAAAGCTKPGPTPHTNCRGCGTTNRQLERTATKAAAEARRADHTATAAASRAQRDTIVQADPAVRRQVRETVTANRGVSW